MAVTQTNPRRWLIVLLWIAALFATADTLYTGLVLRVENANHMDFANYWVMAGELAQGTNVYAMSPGELQGLVDRYELGVPVAKEPRYSPLFFALMIPLSWLPFAAAGWIWFSLQAALLVLAAGMLARLFGRELGELAGPAALLTVMANWSVIYELDLGNVNLLLLVLLLGAALALHERGRLGWWAASGAALMLLVKPTLAVLLLPLLRRGHWMSLGRVSAVWIAGRLIGALMLGFEVEAAYWPSLLGTFGEPIVDRNPYVVSLLHTFSTVLQPLGADWLHWALWLLVAAGIGVWALWRVVLRPTRTDPRLLLGWLVAVYWVVSPLAFRQAYVFAPLPLLAGLLLMRLTPAQTAALAFAWLAVTIRISFMRFPAFDSGLPALIAQPALIGALVVLVLLAPGQAFPREGSR